MENLINLDQVSDENKEKIMQILKEEEIAKNNHLTLEQKELDEFFAKTRKPKDPNAKPTNFDDLEFIELDTRESFTNALTDPNYGKYVRDNMRRERMDGALNPQDKETYRQLGIIHENGLPNFWAKIKNVVDGRTNVSMKDVSDQLSEEDLGL